MGRPAMQLCFLLITLTSADPVPQVEELLEANIASDDKLSKFESVALEGQQVLHRFKDVETRVADVASQVDDIQKMLDGVRAEMEKEMTKDEKEKLYWRWTYPWDEMEQEFGGMTGSLKIVSSASQDIYKFMDDHMKKKKMSLLEVPTDPIIDPKIAAEENDLKELVHDLKENRKVAAKMAEDPRLKELVHDMKNIVDPTKKLEEGYAKDLVHDLKKMSDPAAVRDDVKEQLQATAEATAEKAAAGTQVSLGFAAATLCVALASL